MAGVMGEKGEIWVCEHGQQAAQEVKNAFEEGRVLNPVRVLGPDFDFDSFFREGKAFPLMVLIDLSNPEAWRIIKGIGKADTNGKIAIVAMVDEATENLLDRAYDAGVRTYLRKPVTFAEFIQRTKLLNMNFSIQRPGN